MKTLTNVFQKSMRVMLLLSLLLSLLLTLPVSVVNAKPLSTIINVACGDVAGLISAISNANNESTHPGLDIINLDANCIYILTSIQSNYYGDLGLPYVSSEIIINGNGSTILRDSGSPNFRFTSVSETGKLSINDLTFSGGRLTTGNIDGEGAAIWLFLSELNLNNVTFINNYSLSLGGAVCNVAGTTHIQNSTFTNNAGYHGGAICNRQGNMTIIDSYVVSNTAQGLGGGIYSSGSLSITNTEIYDNETTRTDGGGGGVFNDQGTLSIIDSLILNNISARGAGIFSQGPNTTEIHGSTISDNTAIGDGGGLFFAPSFGVGTLDVSTTFFNNNSGGRGGGIHTQNGGTITVTNTTFTNNTAVSTLGGAFHIHNNEGASGTANINNSCLVGNDDVSIFNESGPQIDSTNNWWGDESGPTHSTNPLGVGDSVSNNVAFTPWLLLTPTCPLFDNQPPVVDAGGLYFANEGGSVEVTATGTDPEGETLTYAWDLDNNGSFESLGQSVIFSVLGKDGPASYTINVQVTDSGNLSATDTTVVEIQNTAPTATFSNNGPILAGGTATVSFSNQFDPSTDDISAGFHYAFACDGSSLETANYTNSATTGSINCSFSNGPSLNIVRGRIIDKDEGYTEYTTTVVVYSQSTFYLHGTGSANNPSTLFLNNVVPSSSTEKFKDSTGINFNNGNAWKQIGTWLAVPQLSTGNLIDLSNFHAWLGLKNSDDQGTRFDLRIEIYKNGTLVSSGEQYCITGVVRNANLAKEVTLSFDSFPPTFYDGSTDTLSLKIYTRIGTNGSGVFCGGHSNATGIRLYFDATDRLSRFDSVFSP